MDLSIPEVRAVFVDEIQAAIEEGKSTDWKYNGNGETAVTVFDSEEAVNKVMDVLKKYGLL